jgi:hypothetical protein
VSSFIVETTALLERTPELLRTLSLPKGVMVLTYQLTPVTS